MLKSLVGQWKIYWKLYLSKDADIPEVIFGDLTIKPDGTITEEWKNLDEKKLWGGAQASKLEKVPDGNYTKEFNPAAGWLYVPRMTHNKFGFLRLDKRTGYIEIHTLTKSKDMAKKFNSTYNGLSGYVLPGTGYKKGEFRLILKESYVVNIILSRIS